MDASPFSLSAFIGNKFDKPKMRIMTIEEYKAHPFKYNGNGNPVPISEIWNSLLTRKQRREITTLVHKGKNPDIIKYI